MRATSSLAILATSTLLVVGCAHNPWWEATQSGWATYGASVQVPKQAKPVPISFLPEASKWGTPIYIEGWVDSVERESGSWMTISDGTSAPVMVMPASNFSLPRNARGRRTLAWGRPMIASSSVTSNGEPVRNNISVEFIAETVMIQGFYGLEAPPAPKFRAPPAPPPQPAIPAWETEPVDEIEPTADPVKEPAPETEPEPEKAPEPTPPPPPPPVVDLPDRS